MDLPEANSTIGVICTVCEQDAISLSHSVDPLSLRKIVRTIIFRIKFGFEVYTCMYKFCKSADLKFPVSGRSIDDR